MLERLLLGRPEVVGRKVIAMTVAIDLGRCNSESPADYCLQDIIVFRFNQKFLDQNRYKFLRQAAATICIACCTCANLQPACVLVITCVLVIITHGFVNALDT